MVLRGHTLNFQYQSNCPILKDFTCQWPVGERIGLYGGNGVGKTTLLRILATSLEPDSGQLVFGDSDCFQNVDGYRRKLSYLPSEGQGFFNRLTGRENLEVFFYYRQPQWPLASALAEWSQLTSFKKALAAPFFLSSSGMKQLLALFRCLETRAQIYILDEPAKYLDAEAIAFVSQKMHERSAHSLQILASHQLSFINQLATQKYTIKDAQLYTRH